MPGQQRRRLDVLRQGRPAALRPQLRQPRDLLRVRPRTRCRRAATSCASSSSPPASPTSRRARARRAGQLYVDGQLVANDRVPGHHARRLQPRRPDLRCQPGLGRDPGLPRPLPFTGTMHTVTVDLSGDLITDTRARCAWPWPGSRTGRSSCLSADRTAGGTCGLGHERGRRRYGPESGGPAAARGGARAAGRGHDPPARVRRHPAGAGGRRGGGLDSGHAGRLGGRAVARARSEPATRGDQVAGHLEPVLRRNPELAAIHQRLLSPSFRRDQLPALERLPWLERPPWPERPAQIRPRPRSSSRSPNASGRCSGRPPPC